VEVSTELLEITLPVPKCAAGSQATLVKPQTQFIVFVFAIVLMAMHALIYA
jgi:hypothetical protein